MKELQSPAYFVRVAKADSFKKIFLTNQKLELITDLETSGDFWRLKSSTKSNCSKFTPFVKIKTILDAYFTSYKSEFTNYVKIETSQGQGNALT